MGIHTIIKLSCFLKIERALSSFYLTMAFFPILLLFSCHSGQLTKKEKTEDFLYLYEVLEENYPFFDLAKHKNSVDWLANKNDYLKKIQSTNNDTAYIRTLNAILKGLQDGHTDLLPTLYYDPHSYKISAATMPEYISWVKANEKDSTRAKYWSAILRSENQIKEIPEVKSAYSDTIMANKGIAIMNIPSFSGNYVSVDAPKIEQFLSNLSGINTLIINIQGNGGGSTHYWQEFIVPRLISDTIKYSFYIAIKKGAINREYFYPYFESGNEVTKDDSIYLKIPDNFLDKSYHIVRQDIQIAPDNPVDFKGSIYLLVDDAVFSAAEAFATFSQTTGWAIVAGRQTGGDGIGRDPIIISLPNSGIKVRYIATAGFNTDGSLNAERGTIPDCFLTGKSPKERLEDLLYKLKEKSI